MLFGNFTGIEKQLQSKHYITLLESGLQYKLIWTFFLSCRQVCISRKFSKNEMNIHKISIATVILFIFCHMPTTIVNVFKNDGKGKCKHGKDDWDFQYSFMSIMNEIIYLGTLTNASFTFFIYFFIGKKFRKTLLSIFLNIKKIINHLSKN